MTEKHNFPAVDDIPAEQQTEPTKPKRTDEEKLQECYERRDRLREQNPPTRIRDR